MSVRSSLVLVLGLMMGMLVGCGRSGYEWQTESKGTFWTRASEFAAEEEQFGMDFKNEFNRWKYDEWKKRPVGQRVYVDRDGGDCGGKPCE